MKYQRSDLPQVFDEITHPGYLVKYACHQTGNAPRYRVVWAGYYALAEVIGLLYECWTPKHVVEFWKKSIRKENFKQQVGK